MSDLGEPTKRDYDEARAWISETLGSMYPDESWPHSLAAFRAAARREERERCINITRDHPFGSAADIRAAIREGEE